MKKVFLPNVLVSHELFGGSFYLEGAAFLGFRVNLMDRSTLECDLLIPIVDYSVPQNKEQFVTSMAQVAEQVLTGGPVFMGCYGGRGRTGVALASLARLMGEPEPIAWLQTNYMLNAPETEEQKAFILSLPCGLLQSEKERNDWANRGRLIVGGGHVRSF